LRPLLTARSCPVAPSVRARSARPDRSDEVPYRPILKGVSCELRIYTRSAPPYRQAAALLDELSPETGGLNHATTRNPMLAVGKRIEKEIRQEIDHPVLPRGD
jgi:hypothetical protein